MGKKKKWNAAPWVPTSAKLMTRIIVRDTCALMLDKKDDVAENCGSAPSANFCQNVIRLARNFTSTRDSLEWAT